MNNNKTDIIDQKVKEDYKYGFVTDIESETLPDIKKQSLYTTIFIAYKR